MALVSVEDIGLPRGQQTRRSGGSTGGAAPGGSADGAARGGSAARCAN